MKKNYSDYKNTLYTRNRKNSIFAFLFIILSTTVFGQTQTFNANGTFVVPAGVTSITVQAWGGGGAGGGSNSAGSGLARGGAGGGGGAYASATLAVTPGANLSVVIGAGGTGVSNNNGNPGGFSTITGYTTTIYAAGGAGGTRNNGGTPTGGAGGTVAASVGTTRIAGNNGGNGASGYGIFSGDGGAGANGGGAGGISIDNTGTSSNGNAGIQAGGGGSGSRTSENNGNRTGGAGAAGRIIITWCPTYSLTSVVATDACEATNTSTVTLSNTTTANLPVGTYTVTYTLYGNVRTATMTVTTAGTGTFTANVSGISPTSSAQITITRLELGSCSSTVNNNSNNIYMYPNVPSTYNLNSYDSGSCTSATVQWQNIGTQSVTRYYLDVSTTSNFSSFLPGYNNRDMGTSFSQFINGLTTGTTYYYRVRTNNLCGTSPSVSSSFTLGAVGGTANSNQNICANNAPSDISLTGYQGSIQWQVSTNNSAFTDISGANSATLTSAQMGVLTATRYYRARVNYGSCTTANSSTVTVTVTTAAITTTPVTICPGNSGFLTASGGCGTSTTVGPNNAGSGTNVTGIGTVTWSNPDRVISDNNSIATASVNNNTITTNYLQGKDFGFSIPLNATITGIEVAINRYSSQNQTTTRYVQDNEVKLVKSNVIIGDNKAVTGNWSTTASTVENYGGTTDLWGTTWTPADINDTNFGVALAVNIRRNGNGVNTASVDYMQITVTYTLGEVEWYTTSSGGSAITTGTSFNPVGVPGSGLANTNTSGTTTYYAACSTNPDCRVAANFVINGAPTIASITAPAALCSGGTLNPTAPSVTANGSTISSQSWQLETTVGGSVFANLNVPYTATFADNGKRIRYFATNSCGTTYSNQVTLTINENTTAPVVGTPTQPDCVTPTGSVQLTGLPLGAWDLYMDNTGVAIATGQTGTDYTVSGLTPGVHYFNIMSGSCLSPKSSDITIETAKTNTWDGTSWNLGTPNFLQTLNFTGTYPPTAGPYSDVDIEGCSCRVTGGATVTIKTGRTMTITNDVKVLGIAKLIFENNASLVQINNTNTNSGNITYNRTTSPVMKFDYVYWASPVAGFTLGGVMPSSLYYNFNPTANYWNAANSGTVFSPATGYIIRTPASYAGTYNAVFVGEPHNGAYSIASIGADKNYLIGNPYPSALDADEFIIQNSTVLDGTIALWTHNTAIQLASNITNGTAGTGIYAYTSDDYAYYNLTGGVGTGTPAPSGTVIPTGKIAAGQAFGVTTVAGGSIVFNNSMRIGGEGTNANNSQFFKFKNTAKSTTSSIEKNRVWLNLYNEKGAFKQTLVGYITGATNDIDNLFDGESLDGNNYLDFYSVYQDRNLSIQGRALPFSNKDEVPLGYSSTIETEFTINIEKTDGVLKDQKVYLLDKVTDSLHNLRLTPYKFNTLKGTYNDRFTLLFLNKNEVIDEVIPETNNQELNVFVKNNIITVHAASNEKLVAVSLIDVSGRKIFSKNNINDRELIINNLHSSHQVLLVKITLDNNKTVTKKIIY